MQCACPLWVNKMSKVDDLSEQHGHTTDHQHEQAKEAKNEECTTERFSAFFQTAAGAKETHKKIKH